jgi:16S rRNA (guanine527-N7)-methyltransferase
MTMNFRKTLTDGIEQLDLSVSDEKIELLLAYHQLLIKWNKAYNLTAVRDPLQMISRHLLDSLSIAKYIQGDRFIDVGTGAGLPGIVLAIFYPEKSFDLLDSNGKKTRFLFQVKTELKLHNVEVHHARVEQLEQERGFDGVLSRAFATITDMINGSDQLLAANGCFYAMKGLYPEDEIEQLSQMVKRYKVESSSSLRVPGEDGERHLIVIRKQVS